MLYTVHELVSVVVCLVQEMGVPSVYQISLLETTIFWFMTMKVMVKSLLLDQPTKLLPGLEGYHIHQQSGLPMTQYLLLLFQMIVLLRLFVMSDF